MIDGPIFFIDTLFEKRPEGGVHSFVRELLPGLQARGVNAQLISEPGPLRENSLQMARRGVPVHREIFDRTRHLPETCGRLVAEFVNEHPGSTYIIVNSPDVAWLALPWLSSDIRAAALAHNDVGAYYDPVVHYGAYLSDCAGVSTWIASELRRIVMSADAPTWLPYGVRRGALKPSINGRSDPLRLIYVGRVEDSQKRVTRLVPILDRLTSLNVPHTLTVVGSGSAERQLNAELEGIGANHRFLGWLDPERLATVMDAADILLLVSDHEGLPMVLIEAMTHGVIPVVFDIRSGVRDILDNGVTGFIVPQGDADCAAEAIQTLWESPSLLDQMRTRAWLTTADFTIDVMVDRYVVWIERLLKSSVQRPAVAVGPMPSCSSRYPSWVRKSRLIVGRTRFARSK